ncbi:MAG: alpha/beta hydrolase-fold protein [Isosphaeraceae bacterium]|nr:alpha/beta hydrolase-fold protein [Isosphaeraceae bacterium]
MPHALLLSAALALAGQVQPISPRDLDQALVVPPRGESAANLAERIRASFPPKTDLTRGTHAPLIEGEYVAFILEATADARPRIGGMVNHSRGFDLLPIGETGLWARVERIPTDTKFAYHYMIGDRRLGGKAVEMPDWAYPPESREIPGRKYGRYEPISFRSKVFDNDRKGWIYIPAAFDPKAGPARLMIFQDGTAYKNEHVGTVVDNLIADGTMPVAILLLLDPGVNDDGRPNRSVEYDTLSDRYASFLEKEAIPYLAERYPIRSEPMSRAIGGASSGGICAFTVAWERPDLIGRVCSHIGSFTDIRGGHVYPEKIRMSPKKPIKVFLHDGTNDLINRFGDWWLANVAMNEALKAKGYDVSFLQDRGFHAYWSGGRVLPESLRRTWSEPPAR